MKQLSRKSILIILGAFVFLLSILWFFSPLTSELASMITPSSGRRGQDNGEFRQLIELALNAVNTIVGIGGLVVSIFALRSNSKPEE